MKLVTGATGFVGSAVVRALSSRGITDVRGSVRRPVSRCEAGTICVGDLAADTDWSTALSGVDVVIHTAARVHVMKDVSNDPLAEFRRVNVEGTLRLAQQSAQSGVRRFVFLSSIKVNGEETSPGKPYRADDPPNPMDAYGVSKLEAELGLAKIGANHGMEVVVIRPPLVYGPGVRANFLSMMAHVYRGTPLPFGAVTHNRRSLVALENLVDLIVACIDHPAAPEKVLLVSDDEDLSTAELIGRIGSALKRPARLVPIPKVLLALGATAVGRRSLMQRLLGSLQVDVSETISRLDWRPPCSVDRALRATAERFLEDQKK